MAPEASVVGVASAAAVPLSMRAWFVCDGRLGDVFPVPACECSGERLHVGLDHALSGFDQERAPHRCNPSHSAVLDQSNVGLVCLASNQKY